MAQIDYEDKLDLLESLHKQGKTQEVKLQLEKIDPKKVPFRWRFGFAHLSRRCQLELQALRFITPLVVMKNALIKDSDPKFLAEYAFILGKMGGRFEAKKILSGLDPQLTPEVFLYRSFLAFSEWDYKAPIDWLRQYLEMNAPTPYEKMVAKINLLFCLNSTRDQQEHESICQSILAEEVSPLIVGTVYRSRALFHIHSKEYNQAESNLLKALEILKGGGTRIGVPVEKWLRILPILKQTHSKKDIQSLRQFREDCLLSKTSAEDIRESELFLAKAESNQELLERVYLGSPYEGYRERIFEFVPQFKVCEEGLFFEKPKTGAVIDVFTGKVSGKNENLNPGKLIHRSLFALSHDYYKEKTLGSLFGMIYPEDYFDPDLFQEKAYMAITRTRQWMADQGYKAEITIAKGKVQISKLKKCNLKIHHNLNFYPDEEQSKLFKLFLSGLMDFDQSDLAKHLKVNKANQYVFLQKCLERGLIRKEDKRFSQKYSLELFKKTA